MPRYKCPHCGGQKFVVLSDPIARCSQCKEQWNMNTGRIRGTTPNLIRNKLLSRGETTLAAQVEDILETQ